jgi:SAM-dependent methyltransferase
MSSEPEAFFHPHAVIWTPAKIARFWDALGSSTLDADLYFSKQVGDALIDLVARAVPLRTARVLDYGSGPGYLVEKLVKSGITTAALDTSPASVAALQTRLGGHSKFLGAVLSNAIHNPLADNTFDVIFFLETLEHLLPDQITPTLSEIRRLLHPGGYLILTTPNQENLERSQHICPDCGARFHSMQHVTSWTADSVSEILCEHGFKPLVVTETTLSSRGSLTRLRRITSRMLGSHPLNLVAIGVKQ